MTIHWYPGHMHKAQKDTIELLPQVDLLIEILDARIPWSSENPAIAKLRGDEPLHQGAGGTTRGKRFATCNTLSCRLGTPVRMAACMAVTTISPLTFFITLTRSSSG
jgi:hypothetical protein